MLGSAVVVIGCIVVARLIFYQKGLVKAKVIKKERSGFGKLLQKVKKELSLEFDKFLQEINPPATSEEESPTSSLCCESDKVDKTKQSSKYEIVKIHDDKEFSTFKIRLASGKVVLVKKDKKKNVYLLDSCNPQAK